MAEPSQLNLFSQSTFPAPVQPNLIASSPAIDLAVTVNIDNNDLLSIRRGNGQLVSKTTEKGHQVRALRWKSDGQFLAVGWSDGTVRLMGLENTKAVHRIKVVHDEDRKAEITYIAWALNLTGKRHFGKAKTAASKLRGLLSEGGLDLENKDDLLDLPHELTFLEIDTALPKISPLPVSGGTGDDSFVFSTRASLDFVFRPLRPEDKDVVDIMIVGTDNGNIHLSIYDSFVIGRFNYALSSPGEAHDQPLQLCWHASHPEVSTHSLLMRPAGAGRTELYLVPMDLGFISYSPINLSLLSSKTTTLQKLLRYIKQTQLHMVTEWESTRDLPTRFLLNVQEDLTKIGQMNIVQALYHTVVTGHVHAPVKEWLVDGLAERGHKRWDKAVVSGLQSLRSLVHENMLPSLERCALILSRLSGIARFHEAGEPIGFTSAEITRLVDVVSSLSLVCHKILLIVMEELDLFQVFSTWLRFEIDRQASSSISEELSEKEATINTAKVLAYIEKYLKTTTLAVYLDKDNLKDWDEKWSIIEDGSPLLDMLDKQLKREEARLPYMKPLPQVKFLVDYLTEKAENVFKNIAEAEWRSVRFLHHVRFELSGETINKYDMRTCSVPKPDGVDSVTYTAISSEERGNDIHIFRTNIQIIKGISRIVSTELCPIRLGKGKLVDFKFLNDDVFLALFYPEGKQPIICTIPFRSDKMSWGAYDGVYASVTITGDSSSLRGFPTFSLPEDPHFVPLRMEVKEANSSRGEIPSRVCLLGKDGVTYRVFVIPEHILEERK